MNRIKIGYRTYEILNPEYLYNNGKEAWGRASHGDGSLSVSGQIKDRKLYINTLLHEILHAIGYEYNVFKNLDTEEEERIVEGIANALCHVMADNPALFKQFVEELA